MTDPYTQMQDPRHETAASHKQKCQTPLTDAVCFYAVPELTNGEKEECVLAADARQVEREQIRACALLSDRWERIIALESAMKAALKGKP